MWFIILLVIIYLLAGIRIIPQNYVGLVETFGKFSHAKTAGINFIWPFFQRVRKVSLAIQPLEIPKYSVITRDNADVAASITLNFYIKDAEKYTYNNINSEQSMIDLVRGHLRDIIGKMDLNEALGQTNEINDKLFQAIDSLTEMFGLKVMRVQIDELTPSDEIQKAMDQQLTAERRKTAAIAEAEGKAQSIRLENEAQNDALKATATAQAEATKTRADADAYRIKQVNSALDTASEGYFKDQSITAFKYLANSNANTVVMDHDSMTKLGDLPATKKLLGLDKKEG